jgi:hypothetical protein
MTSSPACATSDSLAAADRREFLQTAREAAEQHGHAGNYVVGANIAGSRKVGGGLLDASTV